MYTGEVEDLLKGGSFAGPLTNLGKKTIDIYRRTAQQNCELLSENFTRLADQFTRLSIIKKPEELLTLQKDYLNENIAATIQTTQRYTHILMENLEEFTQIFSNLRDTAVAATKSATKSAVRNAERTTDKTDRHAKEER